MLASGRQFQAHLGLRQLAMLVGLSAWTLILLPHSANAKVLAEHLQAKQVRNQSEEILKGIIAPRDDSASDVLYFKIRVNPLSDILIDTAPRPENGSFLAGLVFSQGAVENLGIGNAWDAAAYSAFCKTFAYSTNVPGELNLRTDKPEFGRESPYTVPRRNTLTTLVIKVVYLPGAPDQVTVWLNPDLSPQATEASQSEEIVTHFPANASFDQIQLVHRGKGDGWIFDDIVAATSFDDFVTAPLWLRPWFLGLAGVVLVSAALGGTVMAERRRARRQMALLEREQAVAAERERIARDIHDEMGASLAQIAMLSTPARESDEPNEGSADLEQIHATSRDLVRAMDEIVWAVDPKHDTLDSVVNYLGRTAEDSLRAGGVRCRLNFPRPIPKLQFTSRIRHNLFLLLKEALHNVVKHAAATEAHLAVEVSDTEFRLVLEDNGKGFIPGSPKSPEMVSDRILSGHGLKNMSERAQSIGGSLSIDSHPERGTRLTLRLPTPLATP